MDNPVKETIKMFKNQNTVIIHFTMYHIALRTKFTTKYLLTLGDMAEIVVLKGRKHNNRKCIRF